jgi:hypothetical protein
MHRNDGTIRDDSYLAGRGAVDVNLRSAYAPACRSVAA